MENELLKTQWEFHVLYYLQHPVNPPVYPVSPVILSKNPLGG